MSEVVDNAGRQRFEMVVDGQVSFVDYATEEGTLVLVHTEVPQALAGRGIGSILARLVLEKVRSLGLKIVPRCEFIATFIHRHPEFADLVVKLPSETV